MKLRLIKRDQSAPSHIKTEQSKALKADSNCSPTQEIFRERLSDTERSGVLLDRVAGNFKFKSKALKADSNCPPTQQNFPREPVKTERSGVFTGGSRKIFLNQEIKNG